MKNIMFQPVFIMLFLLFLNTPVFGFGGSSTMSTAEPLEPIVTEKMKELTIPIRIQPSDDIQQVPLFSEKHELTPVAVVNEEPITLKEFTYELATMHSGMEESKAKANQNYTKLLNRLITIKLIKQEALNIGFDKTPSVQKQIEDFELKTMFQLLLSTQISDLQPDEAVVKEMYSKMALEAKLLTYKFHLQEDAEALLSELKTSADFKKLADKMVAEGKAEGGATPEYVGLNDLFPNAAKAVFDMKIGDISEVFKAEKGYILFKLEDRRVFEDPEIYRAAQKRALEQKAKEVQAEYLANLIDKYATFDDKNMAVLDFDEILKKNPEATVIATMSQFENDQRPLVTLSDGNKSVAITVAEVAEELKGGMYHGIDKKISPEQMNSEKRDILTNRMYAISGRMEAESLAIHKSASYLEKVDKYREEVLFDTFLAKAVLPGLTVSEEDVRRYYYSHLDDYSTPLMIKMKSLVFTDLQNAQEAQKKLRAGSDFKWVSANMTGMAKENNKEILGLDGRLLTVTALPEDLHELVEVSKQGDVIVYAGPDNLYYTLVMETIHPPKAKMYQEVRQEAGKVVYGQKINAALEEWIVKLKEVYETEIFIVQNSH